MILSPKKIKDFNKKIADHYKKSGRVFAWRKTRDPYRILASEIMLQQTQTSRVVVKYEEFLKKFKDIKALANASTSEVLKVWQGLGYNRRAIYLKKAAETIVKDNRGEFPKDTASLLALPGIGQSTAGALQAFCWNIPSIFIETNIRTVFIYFFFNGPLSSARKVSDDDIRALIEKTIDKKNPREWYYALYDYGAMLKAGENKSLHARSTHYKKQSKFAGSNRELRSLILKTLIGSSKILNVENIASLLKKDKVIIRKNLLAMKKEGLIQGRSNDSYKV